MGPRPTALAVSAAAVLLSSCGAAAVEPVSTQAEVGQSQDSGDTGFTSEELVLLISQLPDGEADQVVLWLAQLPDTMAGADRILPAEEASAAYLTDGGLEFGIEATDLEDPYGDLPIEEVFELLGEDMTVTANCDEDGARHCLVGTSRDGMSVAVWSTAERTLLMAAIAPDLDGLVLLLEEWTAVGNE